MRIIRKVIGTLLLITAILVTQIPVTYTRASSISDFQMDGTTLVKYIGTSSTVTIPDSVKKIGREAFAENLNITSVKLGKNVKEIEQGAFRDCSHLANITLSDALVTIGNGAFTNNTSLKSIHLTKNLSSIGSGVFAGCKSLSSVTIDKNNASFLIDNAALYDSKKETLLSYFGGNTSTEFLMPNSVKKIDEYAFWGNDKLEQIALSTNLQEVSAYAFSNCKSLSSLVIPYSVKNIDAKAFENCISLGMVEIPLSVSYIHSTAFDGCPKLIIKAEEKSTAYQYYQTWKELHKDNGSEIGDTLIDEEGKVYIIGSDGQLVEVKKDHGGSTTAGSEYSALHDPSNVDYVPLSDPLLNAEDGVLGQTMVVGQNATVLIDPMSAVVNTLSMRSVPEEEEKTAEEIVAKEEKGDALPKYAIVDEQITSYAYYKAQDLESYTIPSNIRSIGDFSFARSNLKSISIPNSVKTIGYAAFYNCRDLLEITIPSSVTWIEPSAFSYTAWLEQWSLNPKADDFLVVGDGILIAYKGNSSYVTIPEGVETIAPGCFIGREEITGVNIPDTVTIIGQEAFKDCTNLSAVHGASYVKKIQDRAFENTNLQEIVIGEYVEELGLGAFALPGSKTAKAVFQGSKLPKISYTKSSAKIGDKNSQTPVFSGNWTAVIKGQEADFSNTIFEDNGLGFLGTIASANPDGTLRTLDTRREKTSSVNKVTITSSVNGWNGDKVKVELTHSGEYTLKIREEEKEVILPAFQRIYGKVIPEMKVFDMTLWDKSNIVSYSQFGTTPLKVTLPLPENITGNRIHVVALDQEGQLEKLASEIITDSNGKTISFTTNHLSTFAIYGMGEDGSIEIDKNAVLKKDVTPNTGDYSIHPKWFAAIGITAIAVGFFAYRPRYRKK